MNTDTGAIGEITVEQRKHLERVFGRPLRPGDHIDEATVVVSDTVAEVVQAGHQELTRRERRRRARAARRAGTNGPGVR